MPTDGTGEELADLPALLVLNMLAPQTDPDAEVVTGIACRVAGADQCWGTTEAAAE